MPKGKKKESSPKGKKKESSMDKLLGMQQKVVGRYASYASSAAKRLSEGDLTLSNWMEDYSKVWKGLADDMNAMVKSMLPAQTARRARQGSK